MATYKNQTTYNISPTSGDTERDGVNAHVAKTPNQKAKSDVINSIKTLTKQGKHSDAQALFKEQFPQV